MQINGSVALVTGANRGLGRHFVKHLLDRGAKKVYATARNPQKIDIPGVLRLPLDVTDPAQVAAAAAAAPDVTLLVNNAGISTGTNLVTGDLARIRAELDTHFFGTLAMVRAFAPQLRGGAILNVLSAMSWFSYDGANAYSVAKAAQWALTNGVRLELAAQGTQVTGLHLGAADTDMTAGYEGEKADPADIVRAGLDGLEAGAAEVVADAWSAHVKASLADDPRKFYQLV
ncbi:SDR family oxidoreductase [Dactylosporangium matsuzakiense]|uniref:Short-chain dehydrogenase n=1 Tax=Dactylosporangium matsuzakiense TaxID=53360 RepID=A0A9W6KQD7_9ACTN|nr:SDR family oxidoreductase [Dactylosporangium matsuzakiense]UWZ47465.1 SDR family oxidoreductase [Dactylosporangium matsuzakiense]GLL05220.1 short-chain dehydrogenase [Dactylosporangium matsuzakiense]